MRFLTRNASGNSLCVSLRIYAYDLLHFARWFEPQRLPLTEITESTIVN
jgi:hypothetical protein